MSSSAQARASVETIVFGFLVSLALKAALDTAYVPEINSLPDRPEWYSILTVIGTAASLQVLVFSITLLRFVYSQPSATPRSRCPPTAYAQPSTNIGNTASGPSASGVLWRHSQPLDRPSFIAGIGGSVIEAMRGKPITDSKTCHQCVPVKSKSLRRATAHVPASEAPQPTRAV
jgi:hypothetical protein